MSACAREREGRTVEVEEELLEGFEVGLGGGRGEALEEVLREACGGVSMDIVARGGGDGPSMKKRCAAAYCWRAGAKSRMMRSTLWVVGMRM